MNASWFKLQRPRRRDHVVLASVTLVVALIAVLRLHFWEAGLLSVAAIALFVHLYRTRKSSDADA